MDSHVLVCDFISSLVGVTCICEYIILAFMRDLADGSLRAFLDSEDGPPND